MKRLFKAKAILKLFGVLLILLGIISVQAQEWITQPVMPTGRQEIYADTADGIIYIPGGILTDLVTTSDALESFDTNENTWKTLAPLPAPRHHVTPVILGDQLYAIGGFDGPFPEWVMKADVFIYDIERNSWREGISLPHPRGEHVAVLAGGRIHVIGGRTTQEGGTNHFDSYIDSSAHYIYAPDKKEWIEAKSAPTARNSAAAVTIDGDIYVVGGRKNVLQRNGKQVQQNLGALEVYHLETDTWESLSPVPEPFGGIAAAAVDDEIYVFGGEQWMPEETVSASTWIYNPKADTWRKGPDLLQGRHGLAGAAVDGRIYSIGGCTKTGGGAAVGTVEALVQDRADLHCCGD